MKWWQRLMMELAEMETADLERRVAEVEVSIAWEKWFRGVRGRA